MTRRHLSRRRFMQGVATVAGAAFVGPYLLANPAPGAKLGIAFVATGGRGGSHLGMARSERCVAYCDADRRAWGKLAPSQPQATGYTDYRKMFDKHAKEIDAVVVATPDHHHAPASLIALELGKHVYCEKPLTWSVAEARKLAEVTAAKKVATQMGNQGHANEGNRLVVEWVRAGAIGEVREIHTWTNRPIWPQGIATRPPTAPPPETLDWDCWIGPAPFREYHGSLHNFAWRGWFDFGCGAIGDMGCHTWDNVFWAMDPDYPTSVELVAIEGKTAEMFPSRSHFKWTFPAKGKRPGFVAHWYDGGWKPAMPEELANDPARAKTGKGPSMPGSGTLYIGAKGKLLVTGDYGDSPRLIPEAAMQAFQRPEKTIPRSPGHQREWIMAAKGEKPWDFPGSNFATYAGPITEVMLLGAICQRIGEVGLKIECDPIKRTILTQQALQFASRTNRAGWVS